MEKDRIVGKNRIEGRRTDGNRRGQTETDGDGQRMFEKKFYVTPAALLLVPIFHFVASAGFITLKGLNALRLSLY